MGGEKEEILCRTAVLILLKRKQQIIMSMQNDHV